MLEGKDVIIETKKNEDGNLFDSFGRVLAKVSTDGIDWAEHLTSLGASKYANNYNHANVYSLKEKENL